MTTKKELAEVLGRLVVCIAVGTVINPLLIICGLNWLLEAAGYAMIPYTLASFTGALILLTAFKLKVTGNNE